ncbi:hypothetical protein ZWY2020_017457 [Hordeum vulgare]|nr:hypothetical protein ZWY2020_017457 [Hordeum vulgare]
MNASSDGGRRPLRVFFLPFFARGHLLPLTDLACRMAAARPAKVEATMVVTPANGTLIATTVTRAMDEGHSVRLLRYPFPDVGLESGVECLGAAAQHDAWRVYRAVDLSQPIHKKLLLEHRPDAVVADVPFWWVTDIAAEIGVPRLTFHPVGIFAQLALNNLYAIRSDIIRDGVAAPSVVVPGMPGKEIAIPPSELPGSSSRTPFFLWVGQHQGGPARRLQFINERLVTEVAAFGSRLWDGGKRNVRVDDADTVPAEAIGQAVAGFMDGGERWDKMRSRAKELAGKARAAVSENGSSWRDLHRLIDDLTEARASRVPSYEDS